MGKNRPSNRTVRRPAVALLIETSNSYCRELLHGIRAYLREGSHWAVHLTEQGRGDVPPPWLRHWKGDGIIARIENDSIERAVRSANVPVVNVSAAGLKSQFPTVISDSAEVARLAASHLLERGFHHFGYCGDGRFAWSANHGRNFVEHLRQSGCGCNVFEAEPEDFGNWERERHKLAQWIQALPKPVGIMACYDIRGQQVLDVCRQLGRAVPDEVAVIGQHNDELLCELCDPPLSSVIPNARGAGYQAAALLNRMMRGYKVAARTHCVPPTGVATRQSSDIVALGDRQIAEAVRFIRKQACAGIRVEDVLKAVPMSRTLLERKFRKLIGRAPYEEICLVRLRKAKELLSRGDLAIGEVAECAGFASAEYLSAAFKKHAGVSPREFRRRNLHPA